MKKIISKGIKVLARSKVLISVLVLTTLLVLPVMALAVEDAPDVDLWEALERVTNYLFALLIVVAAIFLIAAAFQFITAQGDPEKVKKARDYVLYALIGVVVGVLAKGLITFVQTMIEGV